MDSTSRSFPFNFFYCLILLILSFSDPSSASSAPDNLQATNNANMIKIDPLYTPLKTLIPFTKLYIPSGFDANDRVVIFGEGNFPNRCFRVGPVNFEVDRRSKTIVLKHEAYEYYGSCLPQSDEFQIPIELQVLSEGTYTIKQPIVDLQNGSLRLETIDEITIHPVPEERMSLPDSYPYAPINQVFFEQKGTTSSITLQGQFKDSCLNFAEKPKVPIVSIEERVIVVQPVVETLQSNEGCHSGHFGFKKVIEFATPKAGNYFIHVRSQSGRALNIFVNIEDESSSKDPGKDIGPV